MSPDEIDNLSQEVKLALTSQQEPPSPASDEVLDIDGVKLNVMKIHGTMFARPNRMTAMMGLRSTEEHIANFDKLVEQGDPILLDISTPGGDAELMFEFAEKIRDAGDQVTGYAAGVCCSAGMLMLTACKDRYAHKTATLGSIGAVHTIRIEESEGFQSFYSEGAENKKPTPDNVQKHINRMGNDFVEYVAEFTGMTTEEVKTRGDKANVFSGKEAAENEFIHDVTNFKTAARIATGASSATNYNNNEGNTQMADDKTSQVTLEAAIAENNKRWEALLSSDVAVNKETVIKIASNVKLSTEEAVELLGSIAVPASPAAPAAPADPAPAAAPAAAPAPEAPALSAEQLTAQLVALQAQLNGAPVAGAPTDGEPVGEPDAEGPVDEREKQAQLDADWVAKTQKLFKGAK